MLLGRKPGWVRGSIAFWAAFAAENRSSIAANPCMSGGLGTLKTAGIPYATGCRGAAQAAYRCEQSWSTQRRRWRWQMPQASRGRGPGGRRARGCPG